MGMFDFLDKIGLKTVLEAVKGKIPTVSNPNLLINPDFKINQRGLTGWTVAYDGDVPITATQIYIFDRWRIMNGKINITNGIITLNGTIIQVLENGIGTNFTATVNISGGTASASYDDSTKTFTIIGTGAVLNWAKLEYGNAATVFIPPDPATELMKCMRYYEMIIPVDCDRAIPATFMPDLKVEVDFQFKAAKRIPPSIDKSYLRFVVSSLSEFSVVTKPDILTLDADIYGMSINTADSLLSELPSNCLGVTVDTWHLNGFSVDAEIY